MKLSSALIISSVIHACVIAAIAFFSLPPEIPLGEGLVAVDIVGENTSPPLMGGDKGEGENTPTPTLPSATNTLADRHKGGGTYSGSNGNNNSATSFGSPQGNPILAQIRLKIERAKYYPAIAKRQGLTGRAEVSFQMNHDGSVLNANIIRSSGNEMLDNAALETIRQAAPYPYYEDRIALTINYSLEEK